MKKLTIRVGIALALIAAFLLARPLWDFIPKPAESGSSMWRIGTGNGPKYALLGGQGMPDYANAPKERHQRFVERVALARTVWGLKNAEGWATAVSSGNGTRGREVIPFWSDRNLAAQCARERWANYEPTQIAFDLFFQRWLPRMAMEHCLAGTNWDALFFGHEVEPDALRDQLARQSGHLV